MPLVKAICTSCGAALEVDNTKDAAICLYCGAAYIVEKAINRYNITNNYTTTNNITAGVVNIYGEKQSDFVVRAGSLIEYKGEDSNAVIPDIVTRIDPYAFSCCAGLKSVVIPDSVTYIGEMAFENCTGLTEVKLSCRTQFIGESAFSGCIGLTELKLPESLQYIGKAAFKNCMDLNEVTIPENVDRIYDSTFENCISLENINFMCGVTSIGYHAFYSCIRIKSVTFPISVTEIALGAFEECAGLTKLTIPDSVEHIGWRAFGGCPISEIIASNDWKTRNYALFECLADYGHRHESEPEQRKNGCYIATAVYGSYDCPQVWVLRRYRDMTLSQTRQGRQFIKIYYTLSPVLVKYFGKSKWFIYLFRHILDKLVRGLEKSGVKCTPYTDNDKD